MRDFIDIVEMATPSSQIVDKLYYHGTKTKEAAKSIWKNGLVSSFTDDKYNGKKALYRPVDGNVYVTTDLKYAIIYALGGVLMGSDYLEKRDPKGFGYLFVFNGTELNDIQPDEDSVGEMVHDCLLKQIHSDRHPDSVINTSPTVRRLANKAKAEMSPRTIEKAIDGEYSAWIRIGKYLLSRMTDEQKLELIDLGAHVANKGNMLPHQMWAIPYKQVKHLDRDGSNFFEYAKLISERK